MEPTPRESIVPRHSSSSLSVTSSNSITRSSSQERLTTSTTTSLSAPSSVDKGAVPPSPLIPVPIILERKAFAIDQSNNETEDSDMYAIGGDDDDEMMDEVDAFLEAHDKGLTDAQNAEAKGVTHINSSV